MQHVSDPAAGNRSGSIERWALFGVLAIALALRLAVEFSFPNVHHPDQVLQTLEPAHRLWTGWGIVTWEWREGIRSWIFPGVLAALMASLDVLGLPYFAVLGGIAAGMSLISLVIVYVGWCLGGEKAGLPGALLVGGLCAIWPDLVYFAPKTLTEVAAAPFLVLAAYLARQPCQLRPQQIVALGVLLGLVFCLRFHLAPALAAIAIWACRLDVRHRWVPLLAGALPVVLASGLLDWATWGTPFQSVWKNFYLNIVENRSSLYGTQPALWYARVALDSWGPAGYTALAIGVSFGFRRAPLWALCAAATLIALMAIAHKEVRFLYPVTAFVVILAGLGTLELAGRLGLEWSKPRGVRWIATLGTLWGALTAAAWSQPLNRLMLRFSEGELAAHEQVRVRPDLCGLGIAGVLLTETGYALLHRPVPIYPFEESPDNPNKIPPAPPTLIESFNYAIVNRPTPLPGGFETLLCRGAVCLQRRAGGCVPAPNLEIGPVLQREGR